jgi:acyl-CoA synthetase (AMP-forming)/AMP-acid ligase II
MVDRSRQLANVLRSRGLQPGDRVAIFMTNVPEYLEVVWAGRLLIGADRPGWAGYAGTVTKAGTAPLGPELEGQAMLYSSGTTGRPKGIVHREVDLNRRFGDVTGDILWVNRYGLDAGTVYLTVGPLYHAAPLVSAMATHRHGGTVVLLPKFYSATEAAGHVSIRSAEWLEHPGSVGRVAPGSVAITDESGRELPAGEDGIIWFTRPANRFSYHGDPEKSASMYNDQGWARMGDIGHLDSGEYGEYGESVRAVVTLRDGRSGSPVLERDIIGWTRERLAHYKCPRSVTFVDSLPRSVAGKMMKHRLIEQLAPAEPAAGRASCT